MFDRWGLHCRHVRHALWDYVSDRLGEGTLEQVERHLRHCARCAREVEAIRRIHCLLQASQETIPASRAGWQDLCDRIAALERVGQDTLLRHRVPAAFPDSRPLPWHRYALYGSVMLLIVVGAVHFMRFHPAPVAERRVSAPAFSETRTTVVPDTLQGIPHGSSNARISSSPALIQRPGDHIVLLPSGILLSLSGEGTSYSLPSGPPSTMPIPEASSARTRTVRRERVRLPVTSPGRIRSFLATPSSPSSSPVPAASMVPSPEQNDTHYVIGVLTPIRHENEVY
ncbi:MAG: zf-HC2 domain-containing protein [Chloroherpetonaceae bacterium]|nr:anti-sigma factor [Chthonomonadaceae bacterium]MDW8207406.1 zf-HC2 domain-containing protein [Chloroherpetonaceae bacterium]